MVVDYFEHSNKTMKTKLIYYSHDGNTGLIAQTVRKVLNADVVELRPKNEFPKAGFKKYFFGGKSVFLKEKPALEAYDKNFDYDLIVLGTPIWAGRFAPPLRTFIAENDLSGKKVGFFVCHGGGGAGKTFEEFKKLQPNSILISTIDFIDPMKNKTSEQAKKAYEWSEGLLKL